MDADLATSSAGRPSARDFTTSEVSRPPRAGVAPEFSRTVGGVLPAAPQFRVVRQDVRVSRLDCKKEEFVVNTELQLLPMGGELRVVNFHLGHACRLPNEEGGPAGGVVTVQGLPAKYSRISKRLKLSENPQKKNLRELKNSLRKHYDDNDGDVSIEIPAGCFHLVDACEPVKVQICTKIVKPKHGIKFHCKFDAKGDLLEGAHIFTYRSNALSSTKEWLPCVDACDQLSLWTLSFDVPERMIVVSCGQLDEVKTHKKRKLKTFVFTVNIPTSSTNLGFVIGDLECYSQPELPDLRSFALPGLKPALENTVASLPQILSCMEEGLVCSFPYASYTQVFIDNMPEEVIYYAGLSIFSVNLLYHKKILDAVQATRQLLALGVASQFFGCFVNPSDFKNLWLLKSLARCMTALYIEKSFGISESVFQTSRLMDAVCEFEDKFGAIVLHPLTSEATAGLHFDLGDPHTCSPNYAEFSYKKGQLALRILEFKLGRELFLKVLHRILMLAKEYSRHVHSPMDWRHLLLSVDSFSHEIACVTGREFPFFFEMFVHQGGHAHFDITYVENRKRYVIEMEIRQTLGRGRALYRGPMTVCVQASRMGRTKRKDACLQEFDGYFTHTIQVDGQVSKHDFQRHSKGRRQSRKKVVISTGEEVSIDMTSTDPNSPILWIRVDPDMQLIRKMNISQPLHQWAYMLRYERCPVSQLEAIERLRLYPVQETHKVLLNTVMNENFFYPVRIQAAVEAADIAGQLPKGLYAGLHPLVAYFQRHFGSASNPVIPAPLNFVVTRSKLQDYMLMKHLPRAIARLRHGGKCPQRVFGFLTALLKFNDNSANRYSDDYYRAFLIGALLTSVTPTEGARMKSKEERSRSKQVVMVEEEIVQSLNMDQLRPSYGQVVSCACLRALAKLQLDGHMMTDTAVFWAFAKAQGAFSELRITALGCLVNLVHCTPQLPFVDTIDQLLDLLVDDPNLQIRHAIGRLLVEKPPFRYEQDVVASLNFASNHERLAAKLWALIGDLSMEPKLRNHLVDLFFLLYSTQTPLVLLPDEQMEELAAAQRDLNGFDDAKR
ncbi:TATA binding protein associated factor [Aphelenchoides fujianensis]|nr:TATA binding protein associated factor [Aphelenchoides fujianensis]